MLDVDDVSLCRLHFPLLGSGPPPVGLIAGNGRRQLPALHVLPHVLVLQTDHVLDERLVAGHGVDQQLLAPEGHGVVAEVAARHRHVVLALDEILRGNLVRPRLPPLGDLLGLRRLGLDDAVPAEDDAVKVRAHPRVLRVTEQPRNAAHEALLPEQFHRPLHVLLADHRFKDGAEVHVLPVTEVVGVPHAQLLLGQRVAVTPPRFV